MSGRTARRRVVRVTVPAAGSGGEGSGAPARVTASARADLLAAEEPLGIRVDGTALTMTMRTPGDDVELAAGFLVGEAIVRGRDDIAAMKVCDGTTCGHLDHSDDEIGNIVDISLAPGVEVTPAARRDFLTTSACGVCGKTSIDDICVLPRAPLSADTTVFEPAVIASLPDRLREAQRVFSSTGGLHAAGLFTSSGELLVAREDVGRHNAVDKIVGWAVLQDKLPLRWLRAARVRPRLVRTGAEGGARRHTAARRRVRAVVARRGTGRGGGADPDRLPARPVHERLLRREPGSATGMNRAPDRSAGRP